MEESYRLMAYWLFKSEPSTWSWDDQLAHGADRDTKDGVRSYQARNNMCLMQLDDQAFFYHSQSEKAVMALLRSVPYPIPTAAPVTQDGTVLTSAPVGVSRHTRDV